MPKARFTPEWAEKIAFEHVEIFCFCYQLAAGCVAIHEIKDRRYYVIYILPLSPEASLKEQEHQLDTFIHELIHVFNRVLNLPNTEERVMRRTKYFLSHHKDFARNLFQRIISSPKCEGKYQMEMGGEFLYGAAAGEMIKEKLRQKYGQS